MQKESINAIVIAIVIRANGMPDQKNISRKRNTVVVRKMPRMNFMACVFVPIELKTFEYHDDLCVE